MDCIYWSNAEDTECSHAVVLSDDVTDNIIDDGTESVGDYVDPRGDSESAGDATLYDDCWNEVNSVDSCFFGNNKT